MKTNHLSKQEWGERVILALVFIAVGSLIYLVFSPMRPMFTKDPSQTGKVIDYLGRWGLLLILLPTVWWARKSQRFHKFTPVLVGLVIMAVAVSLDRIMSIYLIDYVGVLDTTPAGWAYQKLNEAVIVVFVVVALTLLSGGSLGSIYIQKGNLKLGLTIGLVTFTLAALGSPWMAFVLFKGQDLTLERIIPWIPWILIFVLANAAQEELLFRGLFLRKLQPFFGKLLSNVLIVFVFTLLHQGANYTSSDLGFLAAVLPLGLAWGYVMQKTDSIWASILFHAGMDIPVILGIFSNLF